MAQTRKRTQAAQKDLIARLADRGEEAIARLGDVPGGARFVDTAHALRDRLDELQKRLRSLDPLERRVTALEKRLAALEGRKTTRPTTTAAKKKTS